MTETLQTTQYGDISGTPLLIVPGLFGSARNWGVIAKRLSENRPVITVDMRNHGDSFHAKTHSYADLAADLATVIIAHGGMADVLGHSMGGKAAMVLALTRPELINSLIIADIAPVQYIHDQADKIVALKAVDLSIVTRRRDADVQLEAAISNAPLRSFLLQSLTLGDGAPSWKLNLDTLASEMPKIMGFPDITGQFAGKTLFLRGENSDYVTLDHHAKIHTLFPDATIETIANAGHWLHAEQPRTFEAAVNSFLER